jgi:hypothetical protein
MLWSPVFWYMPCSMTTPNLKWPITLWNSFRIYNWKLPHLPYSPDLAPGIFISVAPKRYSAWTSIQIRWEGKGGCIWLADTATKRLLLPRNLFFNGKLEAASGTWWELRGKLTSLYCIYFCNYSLCTPPPSVIWMNIVKYKTPLRQPLKIY